MAQFEHIIGDLYVGESAEENEMIDGEMQDSLYRHVRFRTDRFSLVFKTSTGYIPLSDDYMLSQSIRTVYYPYQNEVMASFQLDKPPGKETLHMEDISLKYTVINDTVFIRSDIEPTYSETIIVKNGNLYRVHDSAGKGREYGGDEFLGLEEVQEKNVLVENLETGVATMLDINIVNNEISSTEKNGALRVEQSEADITQVVPYPR
jgi:hypothetical protein